MEANLYIYNMLYPYTTLSRTTFHTQLFHTQLRHTYLFHAQTEHTNFHTHNSFTHTHTSFTHQLFHTQIVTHTQLFPPFPSYFHTCFVLIGRSWHMGFSGPSILQDFTIVLGHQNGVF